MIGLSDRAPLEDVIPADLLRAEVRAWAGRIGVHVHEIHIRAMRRKWASCSTTGRLTFDRELLSQPPNLRTEIILHELLHLKVGNHGALFRSLLRAHLGHEPTLSRARQHRLRQPSRTSNQTPPRPLAGEGVGGEGGSHALAGSAG